MRFQEALPKMMDGKRFAAGTLGASMGSLTVTCGYLMPGASCPEKA